MITNISSDKYNIYESNAVFLFEKDSDLTLHFIFKDNFEFDIRFIFKTDSDISKEKIERNVNGNMLELRCINFNSVLGTGTTMPVEIATIENKKMYIHFWSFVYGSDSENKTRKVEYTVFIER